MSGLEVKEGEPGQVSKKLMKTQALHAKAQMCDASSTDQKASLPLAQLDAKGRITSPIWMIRQKGDLGSVITFPVGSAA